LQAATSGVAVRAGISGVRKHPFFVDHVGDLIPSAVDGMLDPRLSGPERFIALAKTALGEACMPLERITGRPIKLPVYLGLPELRPGFSEQDALSIRDAVARMADLPMEISEVRFSTKGHASGLSAMAAAVEQINQGALGLCLVGGVDSYFHPDTMEWLDKNRQIVGAESRSAFVPGEGAAFCLLISGTIAQQLGMSPLARVLAASVARETKLIKTSEVCLGEGLTQAIGNAVKGLTPPSQIINDIFCDINGERYRGEEWGFVCLRLPHYFESPTSYACPSVAWGDIGAASGPLFAMLACDAAGRGHNKGTRALLWASSEGGLRAAVVLGFPSESRSG
jgi:3-oxoacyl-[acyl-carrier-protein] synthase-1